jgi:hypothetical protein
MTIDSFKIFFYYLNRYSDKSTNVKLMFLENLSKKNILSNSNNVFL